MGYKNGLAYKVEPNNTISTIKLDTDRDNPRLKHAHALFDYV